MTTRMLFAGIALLSAASALAHHSSAMFNKATVVDVTATVVEFQWANPHVWIEIEVAADDGTKSAWSIEGLGPNGLFRKGWRPTSFQPGDVIQIRFNPMNDGSAAGGFIGAKLPDGSVLGNWN